MIEILQHKTGPLIKWFTRAPYGHSAIRVGDFIYEARFATGVTKRRAHPFTFFDYERVDVYTVSGVSGPQKELALRKFLDAQVGKKYDVWMAAFGFPLRLTREARKSRAKWFCSELVYAALEKIGAPLFRDTCPWEVSPGMIPKSWSIIAGEKDALR